MKFRRLETLAVGQLTLWKKFVNNTVHVLHLTCEG
jgi:hypothetical protein